MRGEGEKGEIPLFSPHFSIPPKNTAAASARVWILGRPTVKIFGRSRSYTTRFSEREKGELK